MNKEELIRQNYLYNKQLWWQFFLTVLFCIIACLYYIPTAGPLFYILGGFLTLRSLGSIRYVNKILKLHESGKLK